MSDVQQLDRTAGQGPVAVVGAADQQDLALVVDHHGVGRGDHGGRGRGVRVVVVLALATAEGVTADDALAFCAPLGSVVEVRRKAPNRLMRHGQPSREHVCSCKLLAHGGKVEENHAYRVSRHDPAEIARVRKNVAVLSEGMAKVPGFAAANLTVAK